MQFWSRDREQAIAVMKLLADIEPQHNPDFDLLVSARFDCEYNPSFIKHVSRKFNVFTYQSTTKATGWPGGCNALWLDSMKHIHDRIKDGEMPQYKWVLCMESDDCPLSRTWLKELDTEWDELNMKVVGDVVPYPKHHINGNAMFSADLDFLGFIRKIKKIPNVGWDYVLADRFRWWGWASSPLIRSIWGTKTAQESTVNHFIDQGVRMLHGVKDYSVIQWARTALVGRQVGQNGPDFKVVGTS